MILAELEADEAFSGAGRMDDGGLARFSKHGKGCAVGGLIVREQIDFHAAIASHAFHRAVFIRNKISQKVYLLRTAIFSRNFWREKNQPLKLLEVYVINK